MTLKDKLQSLSEENKAILATNFYNYETLKGIVNAVNNRGDSIILQLSESSIRYMGLKTAMAMARACIAEEGINAWLHLDHGKDVALAKECIDAGFDSVMIDGSHLPFEENVKITRQVVEMAKPKGINVEAELGYVAKLGQEQRFEYTKPEDAANFIEQTGVDALAVAIGSAHGFYKKEPKLAIGALRKIYDVTSVPLVLHGGSGIPHPQIVEAIRNGITKINLATEIKDIFMRTLKGVLNETDEIDLRLVFPNAINAVSDLIDNKLKMINFK
jgi:fructose-bisphosphate aldolase class II/tagatose 1,6-diphosphate aldolase GatY/KbaY